MKVLGLLLVIWLAFAEGCRHGDKRTVDGSCSMYQVCSDSSWNFKTCPPYQSYDPITLSCRPFVEVDCYEMRRRCREGDSIPAKGICGSYYLCQKGKYVIESCLPMMRYNPDTKSCHFWWKVGCEGTEPVGPPQAVEPFCEEGDTQLNLDKCWEYAVCSGGRWVGGECPQGTWFNQQEGACREAGQGSQCFSKEKGHKVRAPLELTELCDKSDLRDQNDYIWQSINNEPKMLIKRLAGEATAHQTLAKSTTKATISKVEISPVIGGSIVKPIANVKTSTAATTIPCRAMNAPKMDNRGLPIARVVNIPMGHNPVAITATTKASNETSLVKPATLVNSTSVGGATLKEETLLAPEVQSPANQKEVKKMLKKEDQEDDDDEELTTIFDFSSSSTEFDSSSSTTEPSTSSTEPSSSSTEPSSSSTEPSSSSTDFSSTTWGSSSESTSTTEEPESKEDRKKKSKSRKSRMVSDDYDLSSVDYETDSS